MKRGELVLVETGLSLPFDLNPTTLRRGGRQPRLADVDRPRRLTAVEWEGRGPMTLEFTLRLDGFPDRSVHDRIDILERMAGTHRPDEEPPRVRLRYSGFSKRRYIIETLTWGEELRRPDLAIVRIEAEITLREWVEPDLVTSPARRVQKATSSDSGGGSPGRTHTVAAGDTLWALAENYLGSGPRWQEIADLNGVRDPRALQIGTRLRIPA